VQPEGPRVHDVEVVYTLQARRWFARLRFRSVGYSDGTTLTLSHYHML
jgi:hypothetical protein